jgi:hypothetical protein
MKTSLSALASLAGLFVTLSSIVCAQDMGGNNDPEAYFGFWAAGKTFALCAWNSRLTPYFQAVGDPFVAK